MKKLKIVHVCDKFGMAGSTIHGVSRLFAWWMPRFDRERFDVKLYALKQPDPASRALEAQGIALSYLGRSRYDPSALASFSRLIKTEHVDVLHLHGWASSNYGRFAGARAGVPTIMHEHGAHPAMPLTQRVADRLLAARTDTAVAVSKSAHELLISLRHVEASKIRRIYNGAPLEEFRPAGPEAVREEKVRLGLPAVGPVVGSVARLSDEKGLDHFLRAAQLVASRVPDVSFLIVGDGPLREPLQALARELDIDRRVVFAGHRRDVPLLQSIMDIQTFASLWEGAPLTLFEAMAMGRTIVSTNAGGLGEILGTSDAALTVPPANPHALADAIARLLDDRGLAAQLSVKAKAMSRQFDINNTVRQLESLYEELAQRSRRIDRRGQP
jgi:glycosyltransferase involved in cell wall biosynthesis